MSAPQYKTGQNRTQQTPRSQTLIPRRSRLAAAMRIMDMDIESDV